MICHRIRVHAGRHRTTRYDVQHSSVGPSFGAQEYHMLQRVRQTVIVVRGSENPLNRGSYARMIAVCHIWAEILY